MMKISINHLIKVGARPDCAGLTWFREFFGADEVECEYTLDLQLKILESEGRRWLGWAWRAGIVPMWSMCRIDLYGADLSEANLSGAILENIQ